MPNHEHRRALKRDHVRSIGALRISDGDNIMAIDSPGPNLKTPYAGANVVETKIADAADKRVGVRNRICFKCLRSTLTVVPEPDEKIASTPVR